jgi:hypothetical protein
MATKRKTTAQKATVSKRKTASKRPVAKKSAAAKKTTQVKKAAASVKRAAPKKPAASATAQTIWKEQAGSLYGAGDVKNTAEQMMKAGSEMMQQFFGKDAPTFAPQLAPGFDNVSAKKVFDASSDAAKQFSKTADTATRTLNEAAEISRENAEAIAACGNIAVNVSKQMGSELMGFANKSFADQVELSKQALACRTLNDMFDLQNRAVKTSLDAFFSESVKMSEMLFQCASDISEPLNDRILESTDRLTKASAA